MALLHDRRDRRDLRDPARVREVTSAPVADTTGVGRGLLTNRNFLLLGLYFTLPANAGWVVRDGMPAIRREKFSLGQGKAGCLLRDRNVPPISSSVRSPAMQCSPS